MSFRSRVSLVAAFVAAMVMLAIWTSAQVVPRQAPAQPPTVLSGLDVGFRVEGMSRGMPVGKWVVRVDGQWVEPQLSPVGRVVPAGTK